MVILELFFGDPSATFETYLKIKKKQNIFIPMYLIITYVYFAIACHFKSVFCNYFWLGTVSNIHFWLKRLSIIVVHNFGE